MKPDDTIVVHDGDVQMSIALPLESTQSSAIHSEEDIARFLNIDVARVMVRLQTQISESLSDGMKQTARLAEPLAGEHKELGAKLEVIIASRINGCSVTLDR